MSNTHLARGHVMHQFCGFCQLNKVPLLCFLKVKSLYCALHSSSQTDVKCWFFFCNLIYHVKPHPWWWQLAPGSLPVAQWYISPALFNLSITWNSVICLFCLSVPHSEAQCRKTFSPAHHTKHTDQTQALGQTQSRSIQTNHTSYRWMWLRTTTEKNRNLAGLLSTPFIMCFSWELGVCTSKLFITLLQHSVVNNIHSPHIISVILEHLFLQGGWQCRVSVTEQMKFSITLNKWRNKAAVCVFVCVCACVCVE